ncbi:2OG-Fe(II) oxygenase family protein [Frankia gtarii]|uniref:2OG-Fe(II) oxygenase family protein n=1 Tax=Frankia gtarii TaxID=2950102 RepID=UPI0021C1B17A|nr:2OG-Fe(II) oxygenase family protein [Frankia gtarii]
MSALHGSPVDLWPTLIYQGQAPATAQDNARLARAILSREGGDPSRSYGVVHARKSGPDLLRWGTTQTDALGRLIGDASAALFAALAPEAGSPRPELTAQGWAVVYRTGGYHRRHAHHDAVISGVYCVQADEDPAVGGTLELWDPRDSRLARAGADAGARLQVQPVAGLLVAWPSWLQHSVSVVRGPAPRIVVAFNVGLLHG